MTNPTNYETAGGNDTDDDVFLLGLADVTNTAYFVDDAARKALVTKYAIDNDINISLYTSTGETCTNIQCYFFWWLRPPGYNSNRAAFVLYDGYVNTDGSVVIDTDIGIRPALWVKY